MIIIRPVLNENACAECVLGELGPGFTYVTNATSEQIQAGTALARACELCVLTNLGPAEFGPSSLQRYRRPDLGSRSDPIQISIPLSIQIAPCDLIDSPPDMIAGSGWDSRLGNSQL